MNSPDDPALSGIEHIDATTRGSVISEKTGDYHDGISIKEPDLDCQGRRDNGPMGRWYTVTPPRGRWMEGTLGAISVEDNKRMPRDGKTLHLVEFDHRAKSKKTACGIPLKGFGGRWTSYEVPIYGTVELRKVTCYRCLWRLSYRKFCKWRAKRAAPVVITLVFQLLEPVRRVVV